MLPMDSKNTSRINENRKMLEHNSSLSYEQAKLSILADISKSLAIIADNISKDTIKVEIANKQSPLTKDVDPIQVSIVNPIHHTPF